MNHGYGINALEALATLIDCTVDTPRKRHMTGGILVSMSLLFAGLAQTVMTSERSTTR